MGKLSQRSIVDKADIAVSNLISDGGYLNPMLLKIFLKICSGKTTLKFIVTNGLTDQEKVW